MTEGFDDVMEDAEIKSHPGRRAGTEAFAAAVAANLCAIDPDVTRTVEDFISEQTQLLSLQREYRVEEHAARQALLKQRAHESSLRRSAIRLRVGLLLLAALIAVASVVAIAVLMHGAVTSNRVVIDIFHAPPDVPARGDDGTVIANRMRDELSRLQDAVRRAGPSGPWDNTIEIDSPQRRTVVGEWLRSLRGRYGRDVRIGGELAETSSGGLALTVRGNGIAAKTLSGAAADLDILIVQGAEYVYSQSQPVRWGRYLSGSERSAEALEFYATAVPNSVPATQAQLLSDWAAALAKTGGPAETTLSLYRQALNIKPDDWHSYAQVMETLWSLGKEQKALDAGNSMLAAAGGRPGRAPESSYSRSDMLTWNLNPWLAAQRAATDTDAAPAAVPRGLIIADIEMRLHDPAAAQLALASVKDELGDPRIAAIAHFVRGRLASDAGDTATAVAEMEAFDSAFADPAVASSYPGYQCWIGPAEAAVGRGERADSALKTDAGYVDCYRFRADLLDARGDANGAEKSYADAVALAPGLPAAYYSWGVALARRGDTGGAAAKFQEAVRLGPGWADPLKAWGDLLVQQGLRERALGKYEAALKLAPQWDALKNARAALATPPPR